MTFDTRKRNICEWKKIKNAIMKKPKLDSRPTLWQNLKNACSFSILDHILIRACEAGEKKHKSRLRGLVPEPPKDEPYDVTVLSGWAQKLVEIRYTKIPKAKQGRRCLWKEKFWTLWFRVIGYMGEKGVTILFLLIGVASGLAFLPSRIFIMQNISLSQILLPVGLGLMFILWQIVLLFIYCSNIFKKHEELKRCHEEDGGFLSSLFQNTRRHLPCVIRWKRNLGWCMFWIVVLCTIGIEYVRHKDEPRDYVYSPQYMPMEQRIRWLHRLQIFLPAQFSLKEESLVWADKAYRHAGYILEDIELDRDLNPSKSTKFFLENESAKLYFTPEDEEVIGLLGFSKTVHLDMISPFSISLSITDLSKGPINLWKILRNHGENNIWIESSEDHIVIRMKEDWQQGIRRNVDGAIVDLTDEEWRFHITEVPDHVRILDTDNQIITQIQFVPLKNIFKLSRIQSPAGYSNNWFTFLFGIILIFGFGPRFLAVPVYGSMLLALKWRLYRELNQEPYCSIVDELNRKPKSEIKEGDVIIKEAQHLDSTTRNETKLPPKKILAFGFGVSISDNDVRKLSKDLDYDYISDKSGDLKSNTKIINWIEKHESVGALLILTKLRVTPDHPFIRFLAQLAKRYSCKVAFVDSTSVSNDVKNERLYVWRKILENNNLTNYVALDELDKRDDDQEDSK